MEVIVQKEVVQLVAVIVGRAVPRQNANTAAAGAVQVPEKRIGCWIDIIVDGGRRQGNFVG